MSRRDKGSMWVAQIRVWHKDSTVIDKTRGLDAWYACYYLNTYEKNGESFTSRVILVFGKDAEKYIRALSEEKRITYLNAIENQVYITTPVTSNFHALVMDKSVFFLKPTITTDGYEYWEVGSLEKQPIRKLIERVNALKPNAQAKLLSLHRQDVNLFLPNVFQKLTPKQRWAYETACERGYYQHPRKEDLQTIAKSLGLAESTFRTHLRLAESKLLPFLRGFIDLRPKPTNSR